MKTHFSGPLFLFYLITKKGESYYIDTAGNLQKTGKLVPLDFSPDGWQDLAIGWERNFNKFGLIRAFTISLGFLGDGFRILEKIYNDKTIDETVYLLVQRQALEIEPAAGPGLLPSFDFIHRFYYKGEIDFSTYRRSRRRVSVNIMEGGRVKDLQAGENTTFGFPLSDPKTIRVKMEGLSFANRGNYATPDGLEISNKNYEVFAAPLTLIATEGTPTGIAFTEQFIEPVQNIANYLATSNNYSIKNDSSAVPVTINFSGKIRLKCVKNTVNGTFALALYKQNTINGIGGVAFNAPFVAGQVYEKPFNASVLLNKDDRLFFLGSFGTAQPGAIEISIEFLPDSRIQASYSNKMAASFVRVYKALDLFRAFSNKLSGSPDYAVSDLLAASGICFTSGDGLRNLEKAEIKETFSNFFNFWRVVRFAGIGIEEDKFRLERFAHFFREADPLDLGEVKDLEIEPALELFFSSLKLGYQDQNYDDLNGRFEPNSLQEYSSPQKRVGKKLELVAPIRADPYGMEFVRINYDGKTTTDSDSDNDTFAIDIDLTKVYQDAEGDYYKPRLVNYTTITGVPDPALPNVELSPKRTAREWESYFRGVLLGYNDPIKFESATKNKDLVTTGGPGGTFNEGADIVLRSTTDPAFTPALLKAIARTPVNLSKTLRLEPWRSFTFTYLGLRLYGFLMKGAQKSKTNQEQSFTFLATRFTNLKQLENE